LHKIAQGFAEGVTRSDRCASVVVVVTLDWSSQSPPKVHDVYDAF